MSIRILVGMLAAGENERDQAIAALHAQSYKNYEFFLLENLPNKEAHEALYSRFMASADRFDVFLKLDADMVLVRDSVLAELADFFAANPEVELLFFEIIDWYSDALIPGITITRSTARWPLHPDQLLVDSFIKITGKNVQVSDRQAALAIHSPDPSPLQAFRFGIHRAMKAIQDDRKPAQRMTEKANSQWSILNKTWLNFRKTRERRIGLAIAGAELVFNGGSGSVGRNYMGTAAREVFEKNYAHATVESLERELASWWDDAERNTKRWQAALTSAPMRETP